MTDYTRPLLLGYARRDLYVSDQHVERLKAEFTKFATVEGFAMGSTYVENLATAPAAFNALVESLNRYELTAVVIPDWRHLAIIGDPERSNASLSGPRGLASCSTTPHELAGPVVSRRPQPSVQRIACTAIGPVITTEPFPPLWRARPQIPEAGCPGT